MKNLLCKEFSLATPLLTYFFLGFTAMTFLPGYPILCGAFFVCLGMFQGYQLAREDQDLMFTVLLPVPKAAAVRAKFAAAAALQLAAFGLFAVFTLLRMGLLSQVPVYRENPMLGANPVFLAFVLLIFAAFNVLFLGGFFKTAWYYGKPFVRFSAAAFLLILAAETLHHLPGFGWMNIPDFSGLKKQLPVLLAAAAVYAAATILSCRSARRRFDKLDL